MHYQTRGTEAVPPVRETSIAGLGEGDGERAPPASAFGAAVKQYPISSCREKGKAPPLWVLDFALTPFRV